MLHGLEMLVARPNDRPKWIVALTDGHSGHSQPNAHEQVAERLRLPNAEAIVVLTIAVDLQRSDSERIHRVCVAGRSEQCGIIAADGGVEALAAAWEEAGQRLTVSQKVEQVDVPDAECRDLLTKHMRLTDRQWSMLKQAYWVRYVHRRCHILRSSSKFDLNEDLVAFGSTTLRVMLEEADHALSEDYRHDWAAINHEQFVYWDEDGDTKWSLIATKPRALDGDRRELLRGLGMHVPTEEDLRDRHVLDSYLARGLGIELQDTRPQAPFDLEIGTLQAIDDQNFVLTLDFTMKMLCMNERIECGVPCIMEGETGVSKTALTRMLFILKNPPMAASASDPSVQAIQLVVKQVIDALPPQQTDWLKAGDFVPEDVLIRILQRVTTHIGISPADPELGELAHPYAMRLFSQGMPEPELGEVSDQRVTAFQNALQNLREALLAELKANP
eukprot:6599181-Prymnesium_polylepis.1